MLDTQHYGGLVRFTGMKNNGIVKVIGSLYATNAGRKHELYHWSEPKLTSLIGAGTADATVSNAALLNLRLCPKHLCR